MRQDKQHNGFIQSNLFYLFDQLNNLKFKQIPFSGIYSETCQWGTFFRFYSVKFMVWDLSLTQPSDFNQWNLRPRTCHMFYWGTIIAIHFVDIMVGPLNEEHSSDSILWNIWSGTCQWGTFIKLHSVNEAHSSESTLWNLSISLTLI